MNLLIPVVVGQFLLLSEEQREREFVMEDATYYCRSVGKPMLILGRPRGRHSCGNPAYGDVCGDIDPAVLEECPGTGMVMDLEGPLPFADGQFGAACFMHVLEHLNDAPGALAEVARVADIVYVAYPRRMSLINIFHPDHKWFIDIIDDWIYLTPRGIAQA